MSFDLFSISMIFWAQQKLSPHILRKETEIALRCNDAFLHSSWMVQLRFELKELPEVVQYCNVLDCGSGFNFSSHSLKGQ